MRLPYRARAHLLLLLCAVTTVVVSRAQDSPRQWLAGDTHIHSHWSPGYDRTTSPPTPILGLDALYPTPLNAQMARKFGLSWMVTTDHGGAQHSKLNLTQAYNELERSRELVPEVLQFYGMELNMPGMDHHTLIVPRADFEASLLYDLESRFDANELFPPDPSRNSATARVEALTYMASLPRLPLVFANHPSRSAKAIGQFGATEPWEIRQGHDSAPDVYRGMEGGPGHQAGGLDRDGTPRRNDQGDLTGGRGGYANKGAPTLGGFDQMTAIVGGVWDSLLGEGRRFWIVASSDSHVHYTTATRRGSDFWPGEFHKTYVHARPVHDDVLDGLRNGRMFAVSGDLVAGLQVEAASGERRAALGESITTARGAPTTITIRFQDPETLNHAGRNPKVARVDVIVGEVRGTLIDRHAAVNETAKVIARFTSNDWTKTRDGEFEMSVTLPPAAADIYVRVRGTNTTDLEPGLDSPGENPWEDLWFYSNPIFISVARSETQ